MQSRNCLLRCLHFKDTVSYMSSGDKDHKFSPRSFTAFWMVMAVSIKCSNCCPVIRESFVIVILWTQGQGGPPLQDQKWRRGSFGSVWPRKWWTHGEWVPSLQSCPALCNPIDYSLPGFSVHGILQARILEWVASAFLQESFPTQRWNQCVLHYTDFLPLSHKEAQRTQWLMPTLH